MRYEDWVIKLQIYINAVIDKPFRYGGNDCCGFASGVIESITGINVLEHINYKRELKTYQKHKGLGLSDLIEQTLQKYMFKEISPLLAGRGDVVLCDGDNGITVGICMGSYIFLPGKSGLVATLLLNGKRAWRIE